MDVLSAQVRARLPLLPEPLESRWVAGRITDGVLDVAVTEVVYLLNNPGRKLTRKAVARSPSVRITNIFYYFCSISLDNLLRLP